MAKGLPYERYMQEFKKIMVETINNKHLSYMEAEKEIEINGGSLYNIIAYELLWSCTHFGNHGHWYHSDQ